MKVEEPKEVKKAEPVVDNRTAEEIDRSYKEKMAMFMKAKDDFNKAFDNKLKESIAFYEEQDKKKKKGTTLKELNEKPMAAIEEDKEEAKEVGGKAVNGKVGGRNVTKPTILPKSKPGMIQQRKPVVQPKRGETKSNATQK